MNIKDYIVSENTPILEVMNVINKNSKGIAYVCNEKILKGAISDGNIRRHVLSGGSLGELAIHVANLEPKFLTYDSTDNPTD